MSSKRIMVTFSEDQFDRIKQISDSNGFDGIATYLKTIIVRELRRIDEPKMKGAINEHLED